MRGKLFKNYTFLKSGSQKSTSEKWYFFVFPTMKKGIPCILEAHRDLLPCCRPEPARNHQAVMVLIDLDDRAGSRNSLLGVQDGGGGVPAACETREELWAILTCSALLSSQPESWAALVAQDSPQRPH